MTPQGTFNIYIATNLRNTIGDYNTVPYSEIDSYLGATGRLVGTRTAQMYTRMNKGRGRVRVDISGLQGQSPISAEKIECADYLTITEGAGYWNGTSTFKRYCFIDSVTYVNDSVYDIEFTEDAYQTWASRLTFANSFVERETTPTDPLFDPQTEIPDVVENAGYNVDVVDPIAYNDPLKNYICVVTSKLIDVDGDTSPDIESAYDPINQEWVTSDIEVKNTFDMVSKIAQGLFYYIFKLDNREDLESLVSSAPQGVVLGVFNIPSETVKQCAKDIKFVKPDQTEVTLSIIDYMETYSGTQGSSNSSGYSAAVICPAYSIVHGHDTQILGPEYSGDLTGGAIMDADDLNPFNYRKLVCFKYEPLVSSGTKSSSIGLNRSSLFQGYGANVKNNKLFSFPYTVLNISNNMGDSYNLQPEKLTWTNETSIDFTVHPLLTLPPVVSICAPYEGQGDNPMTRVMAPCPPSVPFNQDVLAQWFNQNKISLAIGAGKALLGIGVSIATANPVFALAGASSLATMPAKEAGQVQANASKAAENIGGQIGGAINQGVGLAQQVATISQTTQSTSGAGQGDVLARGEAKDHFTLTWQSIPGHIAEKIDNFFTYYGYAIGKCKSLRSQWTLNGTKRTKFYYVKTRGLIVKDTQLNPVPSYAKEKIREIFDNGFRCWSPSNFLDYTNTNAIATTPTT